MDNNEINWFEYGRKFGMVGAQVTFNLPFNEEDDVVLQKVDTEEHREELKRGIRAGVKEVYESLKSIDKLITAK